MQSRIYFHVMSAFLEKNLVENRRTLLFTAHVHCSLMITVLKLWSFFLTVSGHLEYFDGWFYDLFIVFLSCQIPQKRNTFFFFFFSLQNLFRNRLVQSCHNNSLESTRSQNKENLCWHEAKCLWKEHDPKFGGFFSRKMHIHIHV